jgi:hypothetical protein
MTEEEAATSGDQYQEWEDEPMLLEELQKYKAVRILTRVWLTFGLISLVVVFTYYFCCISTEDKLRRRSGIRSASGNGFVRLWPKKKKSKGA